MIYTDAGFFILLYSIGENISHRIPCKRVYLNKFC